MGVFLILGGDFLLVSGHEKIPLARVDEKDSFPVRDCGGLPTTLINSNMVLQDLQGEVERRFQPKKAASEKLSAVYDNLQLLSRSARVRDCGSYLEFHVTDTEKKLHLSNFCKDRLCPMCNWRRSLKIFSQVSLVMNELELQGYEFLFLTLTVRNCSGADLPATCQMLFDGWRSLYNKKEIFKKSVLGSFRSLEVTRNKKTGEFHPHLHVILAVRPVYFKHGYLTQAQWADLWRSCCSLDYTPVIDIRRIKKGRKGLSGAVAEVAKYAVKSSDFLNGSLEDCSSYVSAFLSALSGRRLCSFTGVFSDVRKKLALDDVEHGDLVHVDTDNLRSDVAFMIVRYAWKSGLYVRI